MKDDINVLYKFINPDDNIQLLDLKGSALQDLLYYLDKHYLVMRDNLSIDPSASFGMEIESEHANRYLIEENIEDKLLDDDWEVKNDYSLDNGVEVCSPILRDLKVDWENLQTVCEIMMNNSKIDSKSGGHIHIGTQVLGNRVSAWLNFLKLWSVYENIIFRFVYGEFLTGRESIVRYAKPMKEDFYNAYNKVMTDKNNLYFISNIINFFGEDRYHAVNFQNVYNLSEEQFKNTIEFRCPNGTLDPVIWQNNFNLFYHLLKYSKSNNFNHDIINNRSKFNDGIVNDIDSYNEIYLSQALELADIIFNKNIDKLYFLRQYLKSYDISREKLKKAKAFTTLN